MSSKLEKELSSEFEYDSTKEYYYVSGDAQEIYFDGSRESAGCRSKLGEENYYTPI